RHDLLDGLGDAPLADPRRRRDFLSASGARERDEDEDRNQTRSTRAVARDPSRRARHCAPCVRDEHGKLTGRRTRSSSIGNPMERARSRAVLAATEVAERRAWRLEGPASSSARARAHSYSSLRLALAAPTSPARV